MRWQRLAQRALAREIVQWVHGDAEAAAAEQASLTLYGAGSAAGSSVEAMLSDPSVPRVRLPHAHIVGARLVDLCVAVKLAEVSR